MAHHWATSQQSWCLRRHGDGKVCARVSRVAASGYLRCGILQSQRVQPAHSKYSVLLIGNPSIGDNGVIALAGVLRQCPKLSVVKVGGATAATPDAEFVLIMYPRRLTNLTHCHAGNNIGLKGKRALLQSAHAGPRWQWLDQSHVDLSEEGLEECGLPPELANDWEKVLSYVKLRPGTGPCRATLIVFGYQRAGKTSLVWRLRNPDSSDMPDFESTDGIDFGAL